MRMGLGIVLAWLSACSFERGMLPAAGDAASDGARADAVVDSGPTTITYVSYNVGKSTSATVTVPSNALAGATYVVAVASKPYSPVASVSGLAATWTKIADQCGARSQTGTTLYIGRGALVAGNVVITMMTPPANTVAIVALYSGSTSQGVSAVYNALDATTCTATNTSADIDAYSFAIGGTGHVVAAVATRQMTHTPGAGLVQRVQETQGSDGDTAGIALVDGPVTAIAGSFSSDVDVAAVAIELRP